MIATTRKQPVTGQQKKQTLKRLKAAHQRRWQSIGKFAVYCLAAIAALELFLGAAGVGMEEILQPDGKLGMVHIPNKLVVWRMEGFSNERFNSQGMRDVECSVAKPKGTYRIAMLGDSTTEGLQVAMAQTYGAQLAKSVKHEGLKTQVLNFACSSYSTGQEVLQFEQQVSKYKPDLTIVLYNRGDAVENIRKPTDFSCEPRPYFFLDQRGKLKQDDAVLSMYEGMMKPNPIMDLLRRNSHIYGVLTQANLNLSIHEPLYRKLRGWVLKPFAPKVPKLKPQDAPYAPQDPEAVALALMKRLHADCQLAGSKLLVVAFPNVVNDAEFKHQIQTFEALANKENFGWFDLTPVFRWNPDPMSLFLQYHFSAKGHLIVAQQISDYLRRNSI